MALSDSVPSELLDARRAGDGTNCVPELRATPEGCGSAQPTAPAATVESLGSS
jgi:hypothetical protein